MTLRDRIARALRMTRNREGKLPLNDADAAVAADAVLSALPCTLSQLEQIERGEMVVVPAPR